MAGGLSLRPVSVFHARATGQTRGTYDAAPSDQKGVTDKLTGRVKQAAADLTDDEALRREERKGESKEQLERAEEDVERKAGDGR
jgi:uncharacterized protein YjbJ (UPF0337 family)